jgi:hypothetical protein
MDHLQGNLRAVQILLGHTKIESTVRYLGVDVEDALAFDESTEVQQAIAAFVAGAAASEQFTRPFRKQARVVGGTAAIYDSMSTSSYPAG